MPFFAGALSFAKYLHRDGYLPAAIRATKSTFFYTLRLALAISTSRDTQLLRGASAAVGATGAGGGRWRFIGWLRWIGIPPTASAGGADYTIWETFAVYIFAAFVWCKTLGCVVCVSC